MSDWSAYHEHRKATDPPPYGEGRDDRTYDEAERAVTAHYAETDLDLTLKFYGSLGVMEMSREEFDLMWYGRKIRRWRRAWWAAKDWISGLRSIRLRP